MYSYNSFWLLLRTYRFDSNSTLYGSAVCRRRPGARRILESVWPLSRRCVQRDHTSRSPPPVLPTALFSPECARARFKWRVSACSGRHRRCISLGRVSMPCVTLVHFLLYLCHAWQYTSHSHSQTHTYIYMDIHSHTHTPYSNPSSKRGVQQFLYTSIDPISALKTSCLQFIIRERVSFAIMSQILILVFLSYGNHLQIIEWRIHFICNLYGLYAKTYM